jgi:sulfur-oxidizing protein SoxB
VGAGYGTFEVDARVVRVAGDVVKQHRGEVDVMIALTHLGKGADTYLAREVGGIDVVVGGHTEDAIHKPLRVTRADGSSAFVLQAGHYGEWVGRADFVVGLREPKVDIDRYRLLPVDGGAPVDEAVEKLVTEVEASTVPDLLEPIAEVREERDARELVTLLAHAAASELEADAVLVGKDAFWGKLPAGPITLQQLYDRVLTQKQPPGTAGFTSLWLVDVSGDQLARIERSVARGSRYVVESAGAPASKRTMRLAVEKRILEHPKLATRPAVRFPAAGEGSGGARFGGELIDVLERYARAQTAKGAPLDAPL